jgi:tRNA 2-thiouridine synthesizing protein A
VHDDDDPQRDAALLASVQNSTGTACAQCGSVLCGHDAVLSIVLGHKNAPSCRRCLAHGLHEDLAALCERALQWIVRRECFHHAWLWASAHEGQLGVLRPACSWPDARAALDATPPAPAATAATADHSWDAGDLGCGDLVLELRQRLAELAAGTVLHLRATDPGAPQDLPAWCGLTGHTLLSARHPDYWIRRRPH